MNSNSTRYYSAISDDFILIHSFICDFKRFKIFPYECEFVVCLISNGRRKIETQMISGIILFPLFLQIPY